MSWTTTLPGAAPLSTLSGTTPAAAADAEVLTQLFHANADHYRLSFAAINRMRQHAQLCDVTLKIGSDSINAHRLVLASVSPYFHAMFNGEGKQPRNGEGRSDYPGTPPGPGHGLGGRRRPPRVCLRERADWRPGGRAPIRRPMFPNTSWSLPPPPSPAAFCFALPPAIASGGEGST